jgi:peptidoglycan/xylan/chitin deacetylase (PgdA/CDA1 family)
MRLDAKRALKCAISLAVFTCSGLRDIFLRLFGRSSRGACVVLYYHSIPQNQRTRFANQLDAILRYTKPVTMDGELVFTPGVHYSGITFDDGFENFAEVALPELMKRKMPSTVFVIADALGKAFGPHGRPERVMSAQQIRALPQDLVSIGSHTSTHPFLPTLPEQDAGLELDRSRAQIEAILGRKVRLFSFPFGGFNERLVKQCQRAGYQRVFTTLPRLAFGGPGEFALGRVRVDPNDWPLEFRLKLAGAYRWLPWAFSLKRRVMSIPVAKALHGKTRAAGLATAHSVIQDPTS